MADVALVEDEVDAVRAEGVEHGPHLGAVLEAFLLHLLGSVGVDRFPGQAVDLEAHGEHLRHRRGRLGVAGAPAFEPRLERLLHRGRRHHHAPAATVHHVGRHVLERYEQPQHVSLARHRRQHPESALLSLPPPNAAAAQNWTIRK